MSALEAPVLRLPAQVDVRSVAALYRAHAGRHWSALDLADVRQLDSAGVALIQALAGHDGGGVPLRNAPPRYQQLCRAHRLSTEAH